MDARQDTPTNPFGMDEACENCRRCETRSNVIHGYGDVAADFLFVAEAPSPDDDATGRPVLERTELGRILNTVGLVDVDAAEASPEASAEASPEDAGGAGGLPLENAYVTHLVRCHGPEEPADREVAACDPFLTAEIRMINPHVIVPIGGRTLGALAVEYTTSPPEAFDIEEVHATTIRGRGFELVPMVDPERASDDELDAWVRQFTEAVLGRDYRQTKGRQER
ncbi:uracil-DNA glycosylase [Halalkaliarchaeum desulfuricum]|uniref:uracil-DNA glycosylase n=1 Tax=Halalkaliarchaeum desulfuricum TaxID=2055893 RepID=UPI000E6D3B54